MNLSYEEFMAECEKLDEEEARANGPQTEDNPDWGENIAGAAENQAGQAAQATRENPGDAATKEAIKDPDPDNSVPFETRKETGMVGVFEPGGKKSKGKGKGKGKRKFRLKLPRIHLPNIRLPRISLENIPWDRIRSLPWIDIVCIGITILMVVAFAVNFEAITLFLCALVTPILSFLVCLLVWGLAAFAIWYFALRRW